MNKLAILASLLAVPAMLLCGEPDQLISPRTSMANYMKRLSTHNLNIRASQDNVSDGEQTERAESPIHEDNSLSQSDFEQTLDDHEERLSRLESQTNASFLALKSPLSASFFALLAHAGFWQQSVRESALSASAKESLLNIIEKAQENSTLNVAQTVLCQHNAHNGWHYMAWCMAVDMLDAKLQVNTASVVDYFGNSIPERYIRMGLKGATAWCLASLARSALQSKAP